MFGRPCGGSAKRGVQMSDAAHPEAKLAVEAKPAPQLYLTEEEFAERYHFGRRTVQRWRSSGDGPPYCRLGARRIFYRVADIERWIAGRTFRHRADELARQVDLQTDADAARLRPPPSATGDRILSEVLAPPSRSRGARAPPLRPRR
jgi:predicted DNA-binding transcriptional regulator AlpA